MEIVSYIALSQTLFAIILLTSKRPKGIYDRILITMMIVIAWIILGSLFRSAAIFDFFFKNFGLIPFTISLISLLYLYVRTSINENPRFRKKDLLHFTVPAVLLLGSIILPGSYEIEEGMSHAPKIEIGTFIYSGISLIYIMVYIVIIFRKIRRHQEELPNHFSYTSSHITFNWIKIVILLFIFNWVITGIAMMINVLFQSQLINPGLVFFINFAVFSFAISYFGFFQPSIFLAPRSSELIRESSPILEVEDDKTKYKKSNLTEDRANEYLQRITALLEAERLYLKPDLSIQEISNKLEVPKHYLTESLNTYMGKNFYTLINEYRIGEFKELAAEEKNKHLTLLALAYDAGFNSKSAFNLVFKKQTGETPSQFLRTLRLNQIEP
jgi:AraC-like DNA-binding protein